MKREERKEKRKWNLLPAAKANLKNVAPPLQYDKVLLSNTAEYGGHISRGELCSPVSLLQGGRLETASAKYQSALIKNENASAISQDKNDNKPGGPGRRFAGDSLQEVVLIPRCAISQDKNDNNSC